MSSPTSRLRLLKRSRQSPTPTRTHRARRLPSVKDETVRVETLFETLVAPLRALPISQGTALLVVAKPEMLAQVDLFARSLPLVHKVLLYCPTAKREHTFESALMRLAHRLRLRVVRLPRSMSRFVASPLTLPYQKALCERLLPTLLHEGLDTCLLPNVLEESIEGFLSQWMDGFRLESLLVFSERRIDSVRFSSPWYLTPQSEVLAYHRAMGLLTLPLKNRFRRSEAIYDQFGTMRQGFRQSIARSIRHCERTAQTIASIAQNDLANALDPNTQALSLSYFKTLPNARLKFALIHWLHEAGVTLGPKDSDSIMVQLATQTNALLWRNRTHSLVRVGDALYWRGKDALSLSALTASTSPRNTQGDLFNAT